MLLYLIVFVLLGEALSCLYSRFPRAWYIFFVMLSCVRASLVRGVWLLKTFLFSIVSDYCSTLFFVEAVVVLCREPKHLRVGCFDPR